MPSISIQIIKGVNVPALGKTMDQFSHIKKHWSSEVQEMAH